VKPLQVDPERGLFDSNMRPHYHFHVEDTGELIDVPPGDLEFARLPPLPPGTESVAVDVVIRVRKQGPDALPGTRALPILRAPLPV
jgi:Fur family iron response transcriptional regulator